METFDLCVIGAGPGGYTAALRAAAEGLKTAIVEQAFPGGVCLNAGCIPTKTLIASAAVLETVRNAAAFGVKVPEGAAPDWKKMLQRKDQVIETLRAGIGRLLDSAGVTTFNGHARFLDASRIEVAGNGVIEARHFVIATGSVPAIPKFLPAGERVLTSTELLSLPRLPKRLLILGGGVIGCEFASLFAALGSEVTIVEMLPQLLGQLDGECVKLLARRMSAKGVRILTGQPLTCVRCTTRSVSGKVGAETVKADYLLVAAGRRISDGLCCEAAGIALDERGFIAVDDSFRTNVPHIHAVGDAVGKTMLAHWASASAEAAIRDIVGKPAAFSGEPTPGCIFTDPEIATLGKTKEECERSGIACRTGKFPFAALGKALAAGHPEGFVKIVADTVTDRILGVHIIGDHASDLIGEAGILLARGVTARELGQIIHAHPTLAEALQEAGQALHDECVHLPVRRKRK